MANQLSFKNVNGWGGKRKGSGRPNLSQTVNHMKRPIVSAKTPLHVTLRLKDTMPNLRKRRLLKEFKESIKKAKDCGLFVIHFSIQRNHIHLIAESPNNSALALGMRSLTGRFAKILRRHAHDNFKAEAQGSVFRGRYHLHVLKNPTEMKNALEYVLLNTSKHQKLIEYIDPYSTGMFFGVRARISS